MTMDAGAITRDTLIDGRYEIRERLGQGGMGAVYRALDKKLNQGVALKILLHSTGSERSKEERRRRFMHEIYAINEVEHRNVVHIQDFGFYRDTPYMVMELLRGKDLNHVLNETAALLPVDYCVDVMMVVSAAIQACHDRGVIHRDLKPGNIMVIDSELAHGWDVKVVDFSISKFASDLTKDGQIVGTPNYLSPEQVSGKVVPASDQYALALLLYVCLTKRHPFEELDGLPLIRAIERGEIKPPRSFRPEIPEELEWVILKAMHTDPAQRFGSMREFGQKIWPWGSQLGQGLWKKYYFETPLGQRPRIDPKRSTTGIPLVLRIAQGEVPMSAATAVVDFQRTTVVQRDTTTGQTGSGSTTLDDPDARAAAESDGGMSSGTVNTVDDPDARPFKPVIPSAPSGWEWQDPSSRSSSSSDASHVGAKRPRRATVTVVAAGLLLGLAGALVAGRVLHRPSIASAPPKVLEAPIQPPAVEQPTHPAAVRTSVAPQPTSVAATAAKAQPEPAPQPPTDAREERAKRSEHAHAHRRTVKENDWAKDPNGNPIPPM